MKKLIKSLALFTSMLAPALAHAACSTPTADAGGTFYNTTVNAVQFCDGTSWYNTGLVVAGATGTSCTNPVSPEGGAYYNTTQNTVQFCNGDDWVNMGTMKFPAASGTACTTPTSPEGGMFYNTTTSTLQFCNGDDWVNATYIQVAAVAVSVVIDGTELFKLQGNDTVADDSFSGDVSISGDYAIVGAPKEDTGGTDAGAAYIFKRTGVTWAQQAKIQSTDIATGDDFGSGVSIDGDYAIVGAMQEDTGLSGAGAAYIFKRTGTTWAQEAKIQHSVLKVNDLFGRAVAISGDYAAVGVYDDTTGSVYVFKRTGTTWAQEAKILASDIQYGDQFGYKVALDNDTLIVSAPFEDAGGWTDAGSVYIYKRTGTSWAEEAKLDDSVDGTYYYFGWSVDLSGDYAIVGSYRAGSSSSKMGAAHVFKRTGVTWAEEARLEASDKQANDNFGYSVAIDGNYAIAGAIGEDTGFTSGGAVYIFKRTGTSWAEELKVQASDVSDYNSLGVSSAMDEGTAIIGGSASSAVYFFD